MRLSLTIVILNSVFIWQALIGQIFLELILHMFCWQINKKIGALSLLSISTNNHLLCVTCSADIGENQALKNSKQATGTVTGIIDGLGSLGTALGQLLLGYTIQKYGWKWGYLFVIAIVSSSTVFPLLPILFKEI